MVTPDWWENLPTCDICNEKFGGSHWHCGKCKSADTTSMYGHYHSIHVRNGKLVKVEAHMSCDPGACEAADNGPNKKSLKVL